MKSHIKVPGTEEVLGKCQLHLAPWYYISLCLSFLLYLGS